MKEIKISSFPPNKDYKNFKKIKENRQKIIQRTSETLPNTQYSMNVISNKLFPSKQKLIIKNIIKENNNVITYYLSNPNNKSLPIFKPGQYITLIFNVNNLFISRPYFLSSSPNDASNNMYRISINKTSFNELNNIYDNLKINDTLELLSPYGEFTPSQIRDKKHIVGICQDIGICPLLSIARSIYEKSIDKEITIFYIVNNEQDILYKNELNELSKNNNIKIVYILKNNNQEITLSLIKSHVTSKFTAFVIGNNNFINDIKNELKELNLTDKDFRYEIIDTIEDEISITDEIQIKDETVEENTTLENTTEENNSENNTTLDTAEQIPEIKEYNIKVFTHNNEYNIKCNENETILNALENNNIKARSKCRNGKCGYCRTLLIWGNIKVIEERDHRRQTDIKYNYIHPCITYPTSDITIKIDI